MTTYQIALMTESFNSVGEDKIKSLIKHHDLIDANNEQRRLDCQSKGIKWRRYQSARFRDSTKSQKPKPAPAPVAQKSEAAEMIEDAWLNTSAQDGGLEDVSDEWREEALFWQSERPSEAEYEEIMQEAKKWTDQDDELTIGEALKIVMGDRHSLSWSKEQQEREDQEQKEWSEKRDKILDNMDLARREIESALKGVDFESSWGGSMYASYRGLELRISDHPQVDGGGFNESTGDRMGESDLQAVIDEHHVPRTREEIRSTVAKQLWAMRSGDIDPQMF
jgi:hypothetical protein